MRKILMPVAVIAATFIMGQGQALAAGTETVASGPGVAGSGTVTFKTGNRAEPVRISVRDDKCDANSVYARYISYYTGGSFRTQNRNNTNGCGTYIDIGNLYINDARGINGVRLEVCVNSAGSDSCYMGAYIDNPLR